MSLLGSVLVNPIFLGGRSFHNILKLICLKMCKEVIFFFFFFLVFLPFLGPLPWHREVPRLGVELEL